VEDGVHGLTVPPRDGAALAAALDRLLGDPALRLRLGANGRRRWEEGLSWDAHAAAVEEILRGAASDRR
jgi:glycosyltransferase involved in cell wall biosynthesis